MRIGAFFRYRLCAPLTHTIQSWGAVNPNTGDIFLRVGSWAIDDYDDGNTWVVLFHPSWPKTKHGPSQRMRHIDAMRHGARTFAVEVTFNSRGRIRTFDDKTLLHLGKPVKEGNRIFAKVTKRVAVDDIVSRFAEGNPDAEDIAEIFVKTKSKTEQQRLTAARLGQGLFRSKVLGIWNYQCAVTGASTASAIRASHIKPWRNSSNDERLDPFNGLPLVATLDSLFDSGHISFENTGRIIVSTRLSSQERTVLGVCGCRLNGKVPAKTRAYLEYHRTKVFLDRGGS